MQQHTGVRWAVDNGLFTFQAASLDELVEKTYPKFTAEEGAEEHCHFGALTLFNQRLFEWLDHTLQVR